MQNFRLHCALQERGRIALCFVVLCMCGPVARAQSPASVSSGNVENGKKIYSSYGCYECHGGAGQGSTWSGARIANYVGSFEGFAKYVRQPKGQMPPYTAKVVSDAELADIYAFLKSLPRPPSAKTIPELN